MKPIRIAAVLLVFVSLSSFASNIEVKGAKILEANKEYVYTIKAPDFRRSDTLKIYVPGSFNVLGVSKKGSVTKSPDKKNFVLAFKSSNVNLKPVNEVKVKISPIGMAKGSYSIRAEIVRNSKALKKGSLRLKIIGAPVVKVGIYDTEDPVKTGQETTYVIEVTNRGSAAATNIKTGFYLPKQCSFVSAKAPNGAKYQQERETIGFLATPILKPKKRVAYKVKCKANIKGSAAGVAFVTYDQNRYPVFEIEGTSIY